MKSLLVLCGIIAFSSAQRGSYGGSRPLNGYKDRFSANANAVDTTAQDGLNNRFGTGDATGNNGVAASTQRIPFDAYGDVWAVNHLSQRPVDKQPFWLINYQAIEAQRGTPGNLNGNQINTRFGGGSTTFPIRNNINTVVNPLPNTDQNLGIQQQLPQQQFQPQAAPVAQSNPNTNVFPSRIDAGEVNMAPELNRNNFGFGIPQGGRGSFSG